MGFIELPEPLGDWLLPPFDPPDAPGYRLVGMSEPPDLLGDPLFALPLVPPEPEPAGVELPAGEVVAAGAGHRLWPRSVPAATAAVAVAATRAIRHFRRRGAGGGDGGRVDHPGGGGRPAVGGGVPPEGRDTDGPGGQPPGVAIGLGVAGGVGPVGSKPVPGGSLPAECSCGLWSAWSDMVDTSLRGLGTGRGLGLVGLPRSEPLCRGVPAWVRALRVACSPFDGSGSEHAPAGSFGCAAPDAVVDVVDECVGQTGVGDWACFAYAAGYLDAGSVVGEEHCGRVVSAPGPGHPLGRPERGECA